MQQVMIDVLTYVLVVGGLLALACGALVVVTDD